MNRRANPDQLDLLNWQPPEPVVAYEPARVRSATLAGAIAQAVSATLKDDGRTRAEIAAAMSEYLGEDVTENMLNAYASEARESHVINLPRFIALLAVTGDQRALQMIAGKLDWAVIDRKYLPAIRLAQRVERRAEITRELDREIELDRRQLKAGGVL